LSYWRDSIEQDDWLKMTASARLARTADLLPQIRVPTLILSVRRLSEDEPVSGYADHAQATAALVPDSRLILFDGWGRVWYSDGPAPPEAVLAIEKFLTEHVPEAAPFPAVVSSPAKLSPREIDVLKLIAQGRSNQQIADQLVLSVRTVERHITNLYAKIGARSKADATAYALRNHLV
jgi:DNA-binding CsgD family transcriptional regulator